MLQRIVFGNWLSRNDLISVFPQVVTIESTYYVSILLPNYQVFLCGSLKQKYTSFLYIMYFLIFSVSFLDHFFVLAIFFLKTMKKFIIHVKKHIRTDLCNERLKLQ